MNKFRTSFLLLALCALLSFTEGCSSAPQKNDHDAREAYERAKSKLTPDVHQRAPDEVAPGFEIKLSSPDDSSINGKYRIDYDGKLKLPYEVKVDTNGMTRDQLRNKIVESYSKFFKTPPHIALSVSEERYWVDVRGLVEKPGRFLAKKDTSIDEVISLAGGLQKNANVRYVKIQQGANTTTTIKLSEYYAGSPDDQIPPWQGGDILFFQTDRGQNHVPGENEGSYVQLIGEVRNPGEYRFVNDVDFYYYLVKAGGPTQNANLSAVQIVRQGIEGKKQMNFNLDNPKDVPTIQSGDIIFLQSDKPTGFERAVPVISGLVGILNTALLLVLLF